MIGKPNLELQDQSQLVQSLLDDESASVKSNFSRNSNYSDSSMKLMKKTMKVAAKIEMENKAEQQAISQNPAAIQEIFQMYEDALTQFRRRRKLLSYLPVIEPQQIIIWKLIIALIILFLFFEIPVYIMYGQQFWDALVSHSSQAILFYTLGFFLLVDMLLDFVTAYYKHGNLVTDNTKIALHYLYGYFIFDLIAVVISLIRFSLWISDFRYIYLIFYFKLPSFLRIDRQISEMILLHKDLRLIYQVLKMLIFMLFCFNVFSCIFYRIGMYSVDNGYNSWLNTAGNFGVIIDRPIHQQYFFSYYFSLGTVSTTMGYGDITPMNMYECTWALTGIMFAVMVFALNINNFQLLMEEYNSYQVKRFKLKVSINKFMRSKKVPSKMQERIRQYLNEYWYEQGTRDKDLEQQIFHILAPELKQELIYCSMGSFLQTTLFGTYFSKPFLKELSQKVIEVSYSSGDVIIMNQANEIIEDQSFYYIISGNIQLNPGNSTVIQKKMSDGEYFGEWSFFTGQPRTATAEAKIYSQLYKLRRVDFLEVIDRFPDDYEMYCQLRDQLLFSKNIGSVGQQCWTCKGVDHYAQDCPLTHYNPPPQNIIENDTVIDLKQNRMEIERIQRKQWPTRVNSHILIKGLNKPKLKRKVTQMLKTQRALNKLDSPRKPQTKIIPFESTRINIIKSESQDNIDDNQRFMSQKSQASKEEESLQVPKSPRDPSNKLEEYRNIQQPYIHTGVDNFDEPANYKNYFRRFNSSNFQAFKGLNAQQQPKLQDLRKSMIKGSFIQYKKG